MPMLPKYKSHQITKDKAGDKKMIAHIFFVLGRKNHRSPRVLLRKMPSTTPSIGLFPDPPVDSKVFASVLFWQAGGWPFEKLAPGCLGYMGDGILPSYIGNIDIYKP